MRITDFRPRQSKEVAEVSADAFADDPHWTHTLPDAERRRLPHLITFRTALRVLQPPQAARVAMRDGRIVGFALWTTTRFDGLNDPHDPTRPVDPRITRATLRLSRRIASDWPRLIAFHTALAQARPNDLGWFLDGLAVRPDHRGTGVGSALLSDGLAQADLDGEPVSLQTSTPENVEFCRRRGFEVTQIFAELYPGSPPLWNMRRPASVPSATPAPSGPGDGRAAK